MLSSSQSSASESDSDVNSENPVCVISRAPRPLNLPSARTAQRRMALQTPPPCILGGGCLPNSERSSLASARASSSGSADEPSSPPAGWDASTDTDTDTDADMDSGASADNDIAGANGMGIRDGPGDAEGMGGDRGSVGLLSSIVGCCCCFCSHQCALEPTSWSQFRNRVRRSRQCDEETVSAETTRDFVRVENQAEAEVELMQVR